MSKYLYGAAVQGIQGFIFQTNELKDIVGASELVDKICSTDFNEFVKEGDLILQAAGNIKCIFENEDSCKKAVLEFPKKVLTEAPGITISQAVVKMEGNFSDFGEAVMELERRLRIQRNLPMKSLTTGLMGIRRSRKTGLPAVDEKDSEFLDEGTKAKRKNQQIKKLCNNNFGFYPDDEQICYNIEDMTDKNDWIAIIHADGNGLGQVVQKIGKNKDIFKEFSEGLDNATKEAAQAAFKTTCEAHSIDLNDKEKVIPFRPVVLSGDDHTVICRGDLAMDYTKEFLKGFEEATEKYLGKILRDAKVFESGECELTACAGMAFIKSSYPFYYGYDLAETLCGLAKKDAKASDAVMEGRSLPQSCLLFYKVEDSFVEDFDKMKNRELTPTENDSFFFGPYYVFEKGGRWTIDDLIKKAKMLTGKEGNALKSDLRQWMSLMYYNTDKARQRIKRTLTLLPDGNLKALAENVTKASKRSGKNHREINAYPVYDMLALNSIEISTKEEER